jgi:hypothetical protein
MLFPLIEPHDGGGVVPPGVSGGEMGWGCADGKAALERQAGEQAGRQAGCWCMRWPACELGGRC